MLWIVIPTRNEASIIRSTIERLCTFMDKEIHEPWQIIIADNGSTDTTRATVREIITHEPRIELIEVTKPGKGGAVLTAWCHAVKNRESRVVSPYVNESSHASRLTPHAFVFMFMDADLATDLAALPNLIAAIHNGADIAAGSRYARGAHVERSVLRRCVSRCNQLFLRVIFGLRVADAPCGFKAVNERVVREIVPNILDTQWFFDTELLIRAQRAGMRIVEIPVAWREVRRGGSFTKILRIIANNLRAIALLVCER